MLILTYGIYTYVSVSEKYLILNEILNDSDLASGKICISANKVEISEENLSSFSVFDRPSIYFQQIFQYDTLNKELLTGVQLIENCNDENGFVYHISVPIVSSDKKTVLIKIRENCNCLLGGYSGEFIFRKENGKWKKIKSFNGWIS